jgi:hypothetical protein
MEVCGCGVYAIGSGGGIKSNNNNKKETKSSGLCV